MGRIAKHLLSNDGTNHYVVKCPSKPHYVSSVTRKKGEDFIECPICKGFICFNANGERQTRSKRLQRAAISVVEELRRQ